MTCGQSAKGRSRPPASRARSPSSFSGSAFLRRLSRGLPGVFFAGFFGFAAERVGSPAISLMVSAAAASIRPPPVFFAFPVRFTLLRLGPNGGRGGLFRRRGVLSARPQAARYARRAQCAPVLSAGRTARRRQAPSPLAEPLFADARTAYPAARQTSAYRGKPRAFTLARG